MSPFEASLTDSYLHVGRPRFGGPMQMLSFMDRVGIERGVAVHGPRLIDGEAFTAIEDAAPGRCRFVSVPPPMDMPPEARADHIDAMLDFGAIGFRVQATEYDDAILLEKLGDRGGIIFAIDPFTSPDYVATVTTWLGRWSQGVVVLPHCIKPDPSLLDTLGMAALIAHPRVYPVISRQTGASAEGFPYADLWPWAERLVALGAGPRLLWASEYPVFFTRAEPLSSIRNWFLETGLVKDAEEVQGFFSGRAQQLFFERYGAAKPGAKGPSLPPPLDPVPVKDFHLATDVHGRMINAFVDQAAYEDGSYHDFLNAHLRDDGDGGQ